MDQPPGDRPTSNDPDDDDPGERWPVEGASPQTGNPLESSDTTAPPEPGDGSLAFFKELPVLILIAFGLALLIKTFLVQAFFIPSESMLPTLQINDRVLVNKLVYRFRDPRRGEIVVFVGERDGEPRSFLRRVRDFLFEGFGAATSAERDFIKRVIGLPGDTVRVRKGAVTITTRDGGKLTLDEPYIADELDEAPYGPFTVPDGEYFVMGDNRPNSSDSRGALGTVHESDIVGRAFVRIWPLRRIGILRRPRYESRAADGSEGNAGVALPPLVALPLARRRTA